MSAVATSDPAQKSAASKRKKKSKKKTNGQAPAGAKAPAVNGIKADDPDDEEEDDEDEVGPSPVKTALPTHMHGEDTLHMPSSPPESAPLNDDLPVKNGAPIASEEPSSAEPTSEVEEPTTTAVKRMSIDPTTRLNAMQQERDSLRAEVTQLRQSLESLQAQHSEELANAKEELEQSNQSRDSWETQYRNLMGKVNQIRTQLGDRLKEDAEALEQARGKIEELEGANATATEENGRLQDELAALRTQMESQETEIDSLRNRSTVSTSNWARERDDFVTQSAALREEYEVAKQAMQDWEFLATEERARRELLEEKAQELQERLDHQAEIYERVKDEADTQSNTVEGLQRALRELQEERKRELRELVEQSDGQLEELRKQTKGAEDTATDLKHQLDDAQKELERALPFEKEVKEKNLLIGKLRHEAVILNDHLTKALRFLKRGKPEDNVDRQLVTNHLLHFLALDRSDPKKFQILQLIAALLGWKEDQKEQAGLLRQGSNSESLKVPISPFRRTPSTPTLSTDFMVDSPSGTGKESLAELWSEFLEREAEAGSTIGSRSSSVVKGGRTASMGSGVTSPVGFAGRQKPGELRRSDTQTSDTGTGQ